MFKTLHLSLFLLLLFLLSFVLLAHNAQAQTNESRVFLTWRAHTYTPSQYEGPTLPTSNSYVTVSLDVLENATLKNLTNTNIEWYVNNEIIEEGIGLTRTRIQTPFGAGRGIIHVSVRIPSYEGRLLNNVVAIPIVEPMVVINTPSQGEVINTRFFSVNALPFFFNTNDSSTLSFDWSVNGKEATIEENSEYDTLHVELDSSISRETDLFVELFVKNPLVNFEIASKIKRITFVP